MAIEINRITNANVYVDGSEFLGKVEEMNVPEVKAKMSDHNALGMFGVASFASGIEKLEGSIKWNSFYPAALRKAGDFRTPVQLMIRVPVEVQGSSGLVDEVNMTIFMQATFNTLPGGNFKKSDNVEMVTNFTATSFKIEYDGVVEFEFDSLANIYKVNGVDLLANYRANM